MIQKKIWKNFSFLILKMFQTGYVVKIDSYNSTFRCRYICAFFILSVQRWSNEKWRDCYLNKFDVNICICLCFKTVFTEIDWRKCLFIRFIYSHSIYSSNMCKFFSSIIAAEHSLREKCPYLELFWSVFSQIRTEYGEILRIQWILHISPFSVRMR